MQVDFTGERKSLQMASALRGSRAGVQPLAVRERGRNSDRGKIHFIHGLGLS